MKKDTAPLNSKDKANAYILQDNHKLICANLLRSIARLGLIRAVDANCSSIEHEPNKVNDLLHNESARQLKDASGDFILDQTLANQIYD